ncbi:MAG: MgtC/SapB family protein [Candidatus Diapherotrites archaeon]
MLAAEIEGIIKLLIATVFGMLIGLERESKRKPAGVRTYALVCLGSCLFTIASVGFSGAADPSRVAAGIVTGVGFLGGGAIFGSGTKRRGITTATSIWVVAAIGIAVGIGEYVLASFATLASLLLLYSSRILKFFVERSRKGKTNKF